MPKRLTDKNRLSITHPKLCEEWHNEKNFPLRPEEVSFGSGKKVWWKCGVCGYSWFASMNIRANTGCGCPACAGRVVTDKNRLSILYPEIAKEWHLTENGTKCPQNISYGSAYKAVWICRVCGHDWKATVNDRTGGLGCPACARQVLSDKNRFSLLYPEIAAEWDYKFNIRMPNEVSVGCAFKAGWVCSICGHNWKATVNKRTNGRGCPKCARIAAGKKLMLAAASGVGISSHSIIAEWHNEKNFPLLPKHVSFGSTKKVWWKCFVCGHGWLAVVQSRLLGNGCPACARQVLSDKNRLSILFTELCKEWDYSRNDKHPSEVSVGCAYRAWWVCKMCGHNWYAPIYNRTKGHGCPQCCRARYSVSKISQRWLDSLGVSLENRERVLNLGNKKFRVDGLDLTTNTVYEFLGDFWHGNPNIWDQDELNPVSKKTFGQLFDETVERLFLLRQHGYNLIIIWEEDFTN